MQSGNRDFKVALIKGLILTEPDCKPPSKWTDGTPNDFSAWKKDYPKKKDDAFYVRLSSSQDPKKYGYWENFRVNQNNYFPVCMTNAIRYD